MAPLPYLLMNVGQLDEVVGLPLPFCPHPNVGDVVGRALGLRRPRDGLAAQEEVVDLRVAQPHAERPLYVQGLAFGKEPAGVGLSMHIRNLIYNLRTS